MKVNRDIKPTVVKGEEGEVLILSRDNMGEPYRDGISWSLENGDDWIRAFIEESEAREIQKFFNGYFNEEVKPLV